MGALGILFSLIRNSILGTVHMVQKQFKVIGMIPARFASTRFPGKPLALIKGKTLIQRTYENAKNSKSLDEVIVATDHPGIFDHVKEFGGEVVMTSPDCPTGSDRMAEVLQKESRFKDIEIAVNIQGDEPCLESFVIDEVVKILLNDPEAVMSTAVMKIVSEEEAYSSSVPKCTFDLHQNALYFSRALIPSSKAQRFNPETAYYKHIGIYGFRRDFLLKYGQLPRTPLQLAEDLEQLKVLEHGYRIKTAIVESKSIGVDLPEDIQKVERLLCKQSTYS